MRPVFRLLLPLLVILPVLFSACKEEPAVSPGNSQEVTGVVRDEQQYIVPNAIIEAFSTSRTLLARDTTDDAGRFTLRNLPMDLQQVLVRVIHSDFKEYETSLSSVTQGVSAIVPIIHADSACGRLQLLIRDVATLAALENAQVKLSRNGVHITTVNSDVDGRVNFNYLMQGMYSLRISKTGYKVVERGVYIQYCDSVSLDIRMEATGSGGSDSCCYGSLRVIPVNAQNQVLVGATVKLMRTGMETRILQAGQAGALFVELCDGSYGVRISKDGYQVKEFSVNLGCSETKEVTEVMQAEIPDTCCFGVVTVIAKDSVTDALLNNVTVKLSKNGKTVSTGYTNQSGEVTFDNKCQGDYVLHLSRDGYKTREAGFTLGCNETKSVVLKMFASTPDSCCTAKLKVRVVDSTATQGGWLAGVTVTIMQGSTLIATGQTDIEGWYIKEALCAPATYDVTYTKQGFQSKTRSYYYNECKLITETVKLSP